MRGRQVKERDERREQVWKQKKRGRGIGRWRQMERGGGKERDEAGRGGGEFTRAEMKTHESKGERAGENSCCV